MDYAKSSVCALCIIFRVYDTLNIVRLEVIIKLGKISVTSHTQLARIASMIASSVVLSRALKQTEQ